MSTLTKRLLATGSRLLGSVVPWKSSSANEQMAINGVRGVGDGAQTSNSTAAAPPLIGGSHIAGRVHGITIRAAATRPQAVGLVPAHEEVTHVPVLSKGLPSRPGWSVYGQGKKRAPIMARGRFISKSLGTSVKFHALEREAGKLGDFCQALYMLIVTHTDDWGRMSSDPFTVKHVVFPTSRRSEADFGAALAWLEKVNLISICEEDGRIFLEIKDFDKNQVGLRKRGQNHFPPCAVTTRHVADNGGEVPLKGISILREEEVTTPAHVRVGRTHAREKTVGRVSDEIFENFWTAYPKKKAKGDAKRAWDKLRPDDGLLLAMLEALKGQRTSDDWVKDGGRFIPFPATWLNRGQWEDADAEVARPLRTSEVKTYQEIQAEEWKWQTEHAEGPKNAG